jgi:Inner membrane component of T3SS, cytoplasmic domain
VALILEVLHGCRGAEVRERHRLDGGPIEIGRALANQVVLDDPHVDARHARLEPQADGSWALVDLGGINRIGLPRDGRTDRVVVEPGVTVLIGKTALRFRDEFAPVPPAAPLIAPPVDSRDWAGTPRGRAIAIFGAIVYGTVDLWLGMTSRGAASQVFSELLAALVLVAIWAGVWSVASRVVLGRFNFLSHVAIGAVALVSFLVLRDFASWTRFLIPAITWTGTAEGLALVGLVGAVVAVHLAKSSHLHRAARWRTGAVAAGVILAIGGISAALDEDEYTPEATFSGDLKMIAPTLVPQQKPAAFATTRTGLKDEIDELMKEQ